MHRYIFLAFAYIYKLVLIVVGPVYMWITPKSLSKLSNASMNKYVDNK